jgi:hypothetical protein
MSFIGLSPIVPRFLDATAACGVPPVAREIFRCRGAAAPAKHCTRSANEDRRTARTVGAPRGERLDDMVAVVKRAGARG